VPPSHVAQLALEMARGDIGKGEQGGNNRGQHVRRWGRGRENIAHCAAFCAYHIEEALEALTHRWVSSPLEPLIRHPKWPKWRLGAKALWREVGKVGAHVEQPLPGDMVLFERGRTGSWQGHLELVDAVQLGSDRFTTIAANLGPYPAKVKRVERRLGRDRLIGFVRLP
jgi:hypothetical protein